MLSSRTMALLARPFEGGDGPTHSTIELIWASAGASDYLPEKDTHNKLERVLGGLRALQEGRGDPFAAGSLLPNRDKLARVVAELSSRLVVSDIVDADVLDAALARDGFSTEDDFPNRDEPSDRLADYLRHLFSDGDGLHVARNHYEQAARAFGRGDWEAANAQFRSACDATFDALAHTKGGPMTKTGGKARQWLQAEGLLATDEAELVKTFMAFAGRAGSHAGLSDAADSQLRRHFTTALMVFAIAKLGS